MLRKALMLAVALAALLMPSVSEAMGIGFFYATGSGDSTTRIEGLPDSTDTLDFSARGLMLDTNMGKDATFNYRLGLAASSYGGRDHQYDGFVIVNDFGFSPARNERARLWIGPEIMISSIDDKTPAMSLKLFGFGMGVALGGNLHITGNTSVTLKAAYITQTLTGHMDIDGVATDLTTEDDFIYASMSLVLRFGERF